ncbi:MAG: toxin-activating lysine-acyltransferase [Hellea sp.]
MSDTEKTKPQLTPEMQKEIGQMRDTVLARLGQCVLSFVGVPRYAHQTIGDLQGFCLAPLMRDRIAIATAQPKDTAGRGDSLTAPLLGLAIWASVSPEVDAKIREQAGAGIFPVKLAPTDWNSGDIIWLLDVIAPSQQLSAAVIANFRQVLDAKDLSKKAGQLRLHPIIKRMLGDDILEKMGAKPIGKMKAEKAAPKAEVKTPKVKTTVKPAAKTKAKSKAKKPTIN